MNSDKVIIIAEAGVNHNGNLEMARQMVREARKAGAGLREIPDRRARAL